MVVFLVSGLWHGASWTFVIWGALNGIYQVIGSITLPLRKKVSALLGNRPNFSSKLLKLLCTFALINFAWIFFRANSLSDAVLLIKNMFSEFNPWILTDGSLYNYGIDRMDMSILIGSLAVLFVVSVAKYKKR